MKNLNHQHLFYFWHTVKEGSMLAASKKLAITQPTISAQIGELEKYFNKPLFLRLGKTIEPTDFGNLVAQYAEEIFTISSELASLVMRGNENAPKKIRVGIVDVIPKNIAALILKPSMELAVAGQCVLSVSEGPSDKLLPEIISRRLDFVVADSPLAPDNNLRVLSQKLGKVPVHFVANSVLALKLQKDFPRSLSGAPLLLPKRNTSLRRDLDLWFHENKIAPKLVGEFDDSALMKELVFQGYGTMPVAGLPSFNSGLVSVGLLSDIFQNFYVIFSEKRQLHSVLELLLEQVKHDMVRALINLS